MDRGVIGPSLHQYSCLHGLVGMQHTTYRRHPVLNVVADGSDACGVNIGAGGSQSMDGCQR